MCIPGRWFENKSISLCIPGRWFENKNISMCILGRWFENKNIIKTYLEAGGELISVALLCFIWTDRLTLIDDLMMMILDDL